MPKIKPPLPIRAVNVGSAHRGGWDSDIVCERIFSDIMAMFISS